MLQMDFYFFNVESISGFTSTFVAIFSANSHPFGFPYRSKCLPLVILNFLVATLINHEKKVALIRVDEYGALARSSEFMNTCHNITIIVQTTGGDVSSLNGKIEIPDKTLYNIKIALLINSSCKKELWYFAYQYSICISLRTDNRFCGGFYYFLCHGSKHSYKQIKIWSVKYYIIKGRDTRKNLYYISHRGYFMGCADTTGDILYWKIDQSFVIYRYHHVWFGEYSFSLSIKYKQNTFLYYFKKILKILFITRTSST